MRVHIQLFATFRELFGTKAMEIEVDEGATIGKMLHHLFDTHQHRKAIFEKGTLKPYNIVLRNGRQIQHLNGLETQLEEGDTISLFPPIAGG